MSLFDFPRINIKGSVTLCPGTANNDDYAGSVTFPSGPNAGQTLALIDSKLVQPRTYGMSDADFIAWVQKAQPFDPPVNGKPQMIIPAEWNYYGDMSSKVNSGDASVIGVQTGPDQLYTAADPSVPLTSLIGAPLTYYGGITDVNSEGSPPATQFFIEELKLGSVLQGPASKGACQWLNFYRNVNLTRDGGAGGYIYHVILKSQCGGKFNIPGFEDPSIIGAIFRYYLYRIVQRTRGNDAIEKMYESKGQNAAVLEFVATIAPLRADEAITTGPIGRLLVAPPPSISTLPLTNNNGGGTIALAPAVLEQDGNRISVEFVGTFPDNNQHASNDKYAFGALTLMANGNGTTAAIGPVDYTDTTAGNQRGWIFDFDIAANPDAQNVLTDPQATFRLTGTHFHADVLSESDYYIVTNQQALYAEQNGANDSFINQGTAEPATISVYQFGKLLPAGSCPPITVWSYSTVPLQTPGALVQVAQNFKPGDPLTVDTSLPGNFTFTFTVGNQPPPPSSYAAFLNPPFTTLTNSPQLSMRVLPNEDFSCYYVDPSSPEPVGNDSLTFDIVYAKVLRTYYLLYPIMNKHIPLNSEKAVGDSAGAIIARTDPSLWMSIHYMPRTRDMSSSRRTLLQAWCRKVPPK